MKFFPQHYYQIIRCNKAIKEEKTMPYIELKTTVSISPEKSQSLKAAFGKAIECFPGKTESWLMVNISGNQDMYFKGDNKTDCAMVSVDLLGKVSSSASEKMTSVLCGVLSEELSLAPDRIYVKYAGFSDWGWNGGNF